MQDAEVAAIDEAVVQSQGQHLARNLSRVLRGRPTAVEGGRVEFEHAALGPIAFVMEDVKRIDHVKRATRRRFVFDRWTTKPMPEPVITADDDGQ